MLSLFSVLIVTYVIFSAQMRDAAYGNAVRRDNELAIGVCADSVIRQIVAGGSSESAAFGQSLLGDLYGIDHILSRVAHRRPSTTFNGSDPYANNIASRAMLLQPRFGNAPRSTLFKFPLHLASWHDDTGPSAALLRSEVVTPLTAAEFGGSASARELTLANRRLPDYRLNDVLVGRILTFQDGPLAGNSFRIVKSFGSQFPAGGPIDPLEGCVVIDLAEAISKSVIVNGASRDLFEVADTEPNALVYHAGDDQQPGFAANGTDAYGQPFSDDFGVRVLINGSAFNGRGQNAGGATMVTRNAGGFVFDATVGPELLANRRITGVIDQVAEPNEQYDAADFDNWFLAWQPSDHRAILPSQAASLAARLNIPIDFALKATQNVIPSFHRPEVINYLMHQPIRLGATDASPRRFSQIDGTDTNDFQRLIILIRRLRAASFRPLNFAHSFGGGSDLNGDGNPFDGAPMFSGSNPVPILNVGIEANGSTSVLALKAQVEQLALWLVNGPWDVDNDGDGIPDSLWTDFDLPVQVIGNGVTVKPMVAALIEDLDGKININAAGNYAHLTHRRFNISNPTVISNNTTYFTANNALKFFNRGGGVGPADINFSHLFDELSIGLPVYYPQTNAPINDVLRTRFGNLLQSRYGGRPWDYQSPLNVALFPIAHPGQNLGVAPYPNFSDPFSRIVHQSRRHFHVPTGSIAVSIAGVAEQVDSPMGRPLDMHGRSTIRKRQGGNATMDEVGDFVTAPQPALSGSVVSEVVNQPYEFDIDEPFGDDRPFTAAEYHSFVESGSATALSSRLVDLLGDAAGSNEALTRLLTFEGRSLDVVELPGGQSIIQFVVSRLPDAIKNDRNAVNTQVQRMLGVELRKGSKLNLNRPLGNGVNDNVATNNFTDETLETVQASVGSFAAERAFPQLDNDGNSTNNSSFVETQSRVQADYLPLDTTTELPDLRGSELLARNLYCLMFRLIMDPGADPLDTASRLFPNFPYPLGMTGDVPFRNQYAAKRLAQWAVNVVDMRDTDAIMTRFRFDPNPFDANGFDLAVAEQNVVWGMERPEIGLSETLAFHDRRAKRNLVTEMDPMNPLVTPDGTDPDDEVMGWMMGDPDPDPNLDQFRIPEASTIVELRSLRDPHVSSRTIESYPNELYTLDADGIPKLDLGRIAGTGNERSPVWRLAVGYTGNVAAPGVAPTPDPTGYRRSVLWTGDAERLEATPFNTTTLPDPRSEFTIQAADETLYDEKIRHTTSVEARLNDNSVVSLYDDDLVAANGTPETIRLERFVWFANLSPDTAGLAITAIPSSGMRRNNVFFSQPVLGNTVAALLPPGGYAVVVPRNETILGQTSASNVGNNFAYTPSPQLFRLSFGGPPTLQGYALRYQNLGSTTGSPQYPADSATDYRVNNILPIVAACLPPHLAEDTPPGYGANEVIDSWRRYTDHPTAPGPDRLGIPAAERVNVGFNISAPLSGVNYYNAPTSKIETNYPLADGYRDYDAMVGEHPDVPFDERNGAILESMGWLGVGTKQDVASIFLQRLADPTQPWNVTTNPYITVDSMTLDLTVFNGEEDMRQTIDPRDDGMNIRLVDVHTPTYPTQIPFDSRRKIPDPSRDRSLSVLVPINLSGDLTDFANYRRIVYAHRSPLMTIQNLLRGRPEAGGDAYFRFQLTSAWTNGTPATGNGTESLHSGFRFAADKGRFDSPADFFPQTFGFVNREMGEPAQARTYYAGSTNGGNPGAYVGFPIAVSLNMPTWLDRPYQSPYEIMSVPATSASRLAFEFSPGTRYEPTANRETPEQFAHLLGFESRLGDIATVPAGHDLATGPGGLVDVSQSTGFAQLTGVRAGFEQIFDVIDTGPLSFSQRRWFDPVQSIPATNGTAAQNAMFERVLQTMHPPFNYVEKHRTPGKVNLNTTPDYIRQGGGFAANHGITGSPFKSGVNPSNPGDGAGPMQGIVAEPTNHRVGTPLDPFNNAQLYGNGSVYRSLAVGVSTAYELDNTAGAPVTMGQNNGYAQKTDSRFGKDFKGFIHSRRGFGTSFVNQANSISAPNLNLLNLDLDFRYPSRFAGMFTPYAGSVLPGVQKYLRGGTDENNRSKLRMTYDMSLLRLQPDFDLHRMTNADQTAAMNASSAAFTLRVEDAPAILSGPTLAYERNAANAPDPTATTEIANLRMPLTNTGLFERSQAELHQSFRNLDRDPFHRFKSTANFAGMTTHHSNVFMVRFTLGFFNVNTATGAVEDEYNDPQRGYIRPSAFYIVDRTIPVGFESKLRNQRAEANNALDTVIYSSVKQ
ncbi:MAG TPA: hypothetical protein DDZ51_06345 [Planctomycetaceae bacterium]|nr:hypothetical protein [Planctomycetaceae bacterium]